VVYPSGAKYHTPCAVHCLSLACDAATRGRLRHLLEALALASPGAVHVTTRGGATEVVATLQDELHGHLRDGDPLNSEAVVRLIEAPLGDDAAEAASWDVPLTVH